MKTYEILHEVGIQASPEAVYQALTDTKKLAAWWNSDTRGNGAKVGGILSRIRVGRNDGMFPHCSTKWAVFMVSLKELLETGKGRPSPDDIEINHD